LDDREYRKWMVAVAVATLILGLVRLWIGQ